MSFAGIFPVAVPVAFVLTAFGSGKPDECGGREESRPATAWDRVKQPSLRGYCMLLARGSARLANGGARASEVLGIADEAEGRLPGHSAPKVLKGRALLELGRADDALIVLREARSLDFRALEDVVAQVAWARANARTGHREEATLSYRAALPNSSALPLQERSRVSFEAGMNLMAQGPNAIEDAIAILREARREAQDVMQSASVIALALALERGGQTLEAMATRGERSHGTSALTLPDPRITEALANAGVGHEADALIATALEATDFASAHDAWKRYTSGVGGSGPWGDHARLRERAVFAVLGSHTKERVAKETTR